MLLLLQRRWKHVRLLLRAPRLHAWGHGWMGSPTVEGGRGGRVGRALGLDGRGDGGPHVTFSCGMAVTRRRQSLSISSSVSCVFFPLTFSLLEAAAVRVRRP